MTFLTCLTCIECFFFYSETILQENRASERASLIEHFIEIAKHQKNHFRNLTGAAAILSALNHHCISRLSETWSKVRKEYCDSFDELALAMSSENTDSMKQLFEVFPFIPWLNGLNLYQQLIQEDQTFETDNFYDHISEILQNCKQAYPVPPDPRETSYLKDPFTFLDQLEGKRTFDELSVISIRLEGKNENR